MRRCLLFLLQIMVFSAFSQPLSNGMGIITHWTGLAGQWDAFSVYQTEGNASAPLGANWETDFYTPNDVNIHNSWKGTNMGNVFGIAIDAQKNIYFTSTKTFSNGFENISGIAGDGGIYKMDADSWEVSPFVFTGNDNNQIPNQGNGLGNIAYDEWNNQLFVTNFEDGKIYRFDMQGNLLSTFDPFGLDDTELGEFSGYGEALWGINVFKDLNGVKVYFSQWTEDYSVLDLENTANNSVWSVDLDSNGEFTGIESLCFTLDDNNDGLNIAYGIVGSTHPISDIVFNSEGSMYVCEKSMGGFPAFIGTTQTFDSGAHSSRTFEYQKMNGVWTQTQQIHVGNYMSMNDIIEFPFFNFPNVANNSAGGLALGNKQLANGEFECEKILWSSGDALRFGFHNIDDIDDYIYGVAGLPIEGNSIDIDDPNYVQNSSILINVNYTDVLQTDASGKTDFGDVEVYYDNNNSSLEVSPSVTICQGESIQLNVTGGENYVWSPALTLDDSNSASPTATPTESTTYTVTGDGQSCVGQGTASITVNIENFSFSLGPDIINCEGAEEILDAGDEAISYNWNTGESTQVITVSNAGNYSVEVTSPNNCKYSDQIILTNQPSPTLAFSTSNNSACPPANFTLFDESIPSESDPIVTWNWIIDDATYNTSTANIELFSSGNYSVTLEVSTELGCVDSLIIVDYLTVYNTPLSNFITVPNEISMCDKSLQIFNLSTDYDSLIWNMGDGQLISSDTIKNYTYSDIGDYTISLNVINEFGCVDSYNKQITANRNVPFYTPNTFTPDNDNLNEQFIPSLGCVDVFEFRVFSRWGEEIFYSNDKNKGWNGTFKGNLCPVGVYLWKVKYNGAKVEQVRLGEVHLMH